MDLYTLLVRENALTEHIVLDIADIIDDIRPKQNPLLTMSMKASKQKGTEFTSYWMEEGSIPTEVRYTGATESSASATPTFADWNRLRIGDVLKRRKPPFEPMLVTATPTTSTVAMERDLHTAVGGTGLLENGEILDIIGTSLEDSTGGASGDWNARMTKPVVKYNLQQKCLDYVNIEKDYAKVTHRGGNIVERRVNSSMNHHLMKLEKRMVFGYRGSTTLGGETYVRRSMGGMTYYLTKNTWSVGGSQNFTPATFSAWIEAVAVNDPEMSTITYFGSRSSRRRISRWQMGKLTVDPDQSERYGVLVESFETGAGMVAQLVTMPWFTGELSGFGFAVNLDDVEWKDLWATEIEMNVQNPADEFHLHKIKTTATILVHNQERMGWHYGAVD